MRTKAPGVIAVVATVAIFLLANHSLVSGAACAPWDANDVFTSMQVLIADHARAGQILLWNPWSNCGTPDYADPQNGAQSPLCILFGYLIGGTELAFRCYWLLTWLGGGLGMLVLTRHLGTPAWGSFIVSSGFLFSGFFTGHAEHTPMVHAYAFLPWIVWRWDVALRSLHCRPAAEAGALWGLSALAGYPAVVVMNSGFIALWMLGRLLFGVAEETSTGAATGADAVAWPPRLGLSNRGAGIAPAARRRLRFGIAALLVLAIIGTVVLSPTYLAFLVEGKGYSDRSGPLPREIAIISNALHTAALYSLASPYLPLLKWYNSHLKLWEPTDVSSLSLYGGAVVTWLALAALFLKPRSGWRWWLATIGIFALGCAMGAALPLRGWLYDLLPPTRYFRHSSLFRGYVIFVMALLAAEACRDLAGMFHRVRTGSTPGARGVRGHDTAVCPLDSPGWAALTVAGLLVAVGAMTTYLAVMGSMDRACAQLGPPPPAPNFHARDLERTLADTHLCVCWTGVVLLAMAALARVPALRYPVLPIALVTLALADSLLTAHLSRLITSEFNPGHLTWWKELEARHDPSLNLALRGWERIDQGPIPGFNNKNLVVKVPVVSNYSAFINRFHVPFAHDELITHSVTGRDRIWFAPAGAVVAVHLSDRTFDAFLRRSHDLGAMPLVIHRRGAMRAPTPPGGLDPRDDRDWERIQRLPPARRLVATLQRYTPNQLSFQVNAPEDGFLLVTDRWARGWRATINGRPAPVFGGNFIFRALALRRGSNKIVFSYHPFGYPFLLYASWGTLGLVAGWSICARVRLKSRVLTAVHRGRARVFGRCDARPATGCSSR